MQLPRFLLLLSFMLLAEPQSFWAQQDAAKSQPPDSVVTNEFVQKEFGLSCSLMGIQPLVADLNGDGVDDIVIPARCKNPMADQADKDFIVLDPYYTFFGYGNPKVTTGFSTDIPEDRALALLIIHGSGKDAWRSPSPASKFVIVNLPYKGVTVKKYQIRKKKLMAIYVEEKGADQMTAVLFWDGKRYRYEPMGSSME